MEIKGEKHRPIIIWKILNEVYGNPKQNEHSILTEKLLIINFIHDINYLNKKSELIIKCRHNKPLQKNVWR